MNYIHLDPYPLRTFLKYPLRSLDVFSEFTQLYGTSPVLSVKKRPHIYGSLRKRSRFVNFGFHAVFGKDDDRSK